MSYHGVYYHVMGLDASGSEAVVRHLHVLAAVSTGLLQSTASTSSTLPRMVGHPRDPQADTEGMWDSLGWAAQSPGPAERPGELLLQPLQESEEAGPGGHWALLPVSH